MNDILTQIAGWIATGLFAVIGWVISMIFGKLKDHEVFHGQITNKVDSHKLHVAENYTTKNDIREMKNEILGALTVLGDKIDKKADKV